MNVVFQRLITGGGVNAVRIEALIQHGALEHGLSVEQKAITVQTNAAQTRIALHGIRSVGELQVVQTAAAQLPHMGLLQGQMQPHQSAVRLYAGRAHRTAFVGGLHCQSARALQQRFHVKGAGLHVGEDLDLFDMSLRKELHPHRLPDAGGAGVVAAVRVKQLALFAPGDQRIPLVILRIHGDDVFALMDGFGHVKAEGNIAAGVGSHADAVDKGFAVIVHRAEVQHDPAGKLLLRQVNGAAIPHAIQKILVVHAGKLALGAEGHQNGIGKLRVRLMQAACFSAAAIVDLKGPLAVQVHPAVAPELRLGMFTAGDRIHIAAPL